MNLRIEVEGLDEVQRKLQEMANRGAQLKPLMNRIGIIMQQSVDKNFEVQGRPSWKQWSELTRQAYTGHAISKARGTKAWQNAKEKGRAGIESRRVMKDVTGGKILSRKGDLRKSITVQATDTEAEVGSPLIYARIHQKGGVIRPKRKKSLAVPMGDGTFRLLRQVMIPARPFLLLQREDETFILRAVEDYMLGEGAMA